MSMNKEELYKWLVEDLWGSFGYNSPEEHARVILNFISKEIIRDLDELCRDEFSYLPDHWIDKMKKKWQKRLEE